jgi:hypothetical protein
VSGHILIRSSMAGYGGSPVSVFCAYDPSTDILAVSRKGDYEGSERDGFLKITNQDRDAAFDALFTEDKIREAITAFFELDALKLVSISSRASACHPSNKIERDGMDERGMNYRISPDIKNEQVAVLAACWYANVQRNVSAVRDFAEEMRLISI